MKSRSAFLLMVKALRCVKDARNSSGSGIGAGIVAVKDIPADVLAAGNPANPLKQIVS